MTQDIGGALEQLESVVRDRLAAGDANASYVPSLAAKGRGKIAQKLGEEAVETVIAALTEDDAALAGEAADLIFHLTVLLAERSEEHTSELQSPMRIPLAVFPLKKKKDTPEH